MQRPISMAAAMRLRTVLRTLAPPVRGYAARRMIAWPMAFGTWEPRSVGSVPRRLLVTGGAEPHFEPRPQERVRVVAAVEGGDTVGGGSR